MIRTTPTAVLWLAATLLAITAGCGGNDDNGNHHAGGDWSPPVGTTWQWQLLGPIDDSFDVDVYDIDLFDVEVATIAGLQADGRTVICYFSAGSWENWREDADEFPAQVKGETLEGWPDERWLDIRNHAVRNVMEKRLDLAAAKGCDAVEPDNVDGYTNANGFGLTNADQLDYNRWLAAQSHARGLSVGLKNDLDQVAELVDNFDWALNEQCRAYDECDMLSPFLQAGKAVFNAEYVENWSDAAALRDEICGTHPQLSTIIKQWDLTARRLACN
ncbi:MAG: endo alpha-1,4 polygalactosaminidase [Candidatus Lernaella stagnicola]|nr:endo alpha-1,4 polygalactosaminidase [Candidatus Lernaella stagnicola]